MFKSFQNRAGWKRGPVLLLSQPPTSHQSVPHFLWAAVLSSLCVVQWGCQPQYPLPWPIAVRFPPGHSYFSSMTHITQAGPIRVTLWDFIYGHRETRSLSSDAVNLKLSVATSCSFFPLLSTWKIICQRRE